ncbi:nucleotidyltransferase domain-containing protein [Thermodesulfobacterium hveragerdense]
MVFGSFARDEEGLTSDLDLFVITKTSEESFRREMS